MTLSALRKPNTAQSVDYLLRHSPSARRELMGAVVRAFQEHPRTLYPLVVWRGYRIRGRLTTFRFIAEIWDGSKWQGVCERWAD